MPDLHFIVNPLAGSGRAASAFAEVEARLKALGIAYEASFTQRPQHGAALAARAIEAGASRIVAAGGDGTVNEVASALFGREGLRFGVLPFGTGNDFARALGLPTAPVAALEAILAGKTRRLDAGLANGRFFINVAGLGFDVEVLRATEKFKKRFNGMLPYMLGIFDTLLHLRPLPLQIEADGKRFDMDSILVMIGNGQYFGGGMHVLPYADAFDGRFDVRIIHNISIWRFLSLLPGFVRGRVTDACPYLTALRAREISIRCSEACTVELDGELVEKTPVRFSLVPAAIELLLP